MNITNLKKRYKAFDYSFDKSDLLLSILGFPFLLAGSLVAKVVFTPFILLVSALESEDGTEVER